MVVYINYSKIIWNLFSSFTYFLYINYSKYSFFIIKYFKSNLLTQLVNLLSFLVGPNLVIAWVWLTHWVRTLCREFLFCYCWVCRIADSLGEILKGIRMYFDKTLPAMLLYKKEHQQYHDAIADNVSPSTVYGAEHLLRLFGKHIWPSTFS